MDELTIIYWIMITAGFMAIVMMGEKMYKYHKTQREMRKAFLDQFPEYERWLK